MHLQPLSETLFPQALHFVTIKTFLSPFLSHSHNHSPPVFCSFPCIPRIKHSLRSRKGQLVNLTLFQFANLSSEWFFFFLLQCIIHAMQLEHYVLAKLAARKHYCSYGCLTLQNAIISFPWLLFFFFLLLHFTLLSSPRCCPWFTLAICQHKMMRSQETPNTRAQKHIMKTQWLEDFMVFQSSMKSLDDGEEAAQPVLDWHPVAVSENSVGGNKAQCHGNHIKSTLKLIYLQKQWKLCWYSPFFALGVCFYNPMSISVRILLWKKNNQVRMNTLWFIND